MKYRSRGRIVASIAVASAVALVAAGCSSGGGQSTNGGKITLTLATFGDFGYNAAMLKLYEKQNPGVTVVQHKAASDQDAHDNFFTKLAAGSGLADVEAVDAAWLPEINQYPGKLYDLTDKSLATRWVDWKYAAGKDKTGKVIGYGTDIGPQAICYRSSLYAAAGLPSDPAGVAKLLTGDWNNFYSVAEAYQKKTGKAFYDSPTAAFQGQINQLQYSFEDKNNKIIATTNPAVKQIFDQVATEGLKSSTGIEAFSNDWYAALKNGAFATTLCPAWMLGVISGNAPAVKDWKIANVYPNGGGNWGGSYLTVPAQGQHLEAAKKLAAWLTAPEQEEQAFINAGPYPSVLAAESSSKLQSYKAAYFDNAAAGQIFADRAKAVTVVPYYGPNWFKIYAIITKGIDRVDQAKSQSVEASWKQVVSEINALS